MERARNLHSFPALGDPERWGGSTRVVATIADSTLAAQATPDTFGAQIIRVQSADLLARGWDLWCTWKVSGLINPGDQVTTLSLEVTVGAGQASGVGRILLAGSFFAGAAAGWACPSGNPTSDSTGAISLPSPIPAAAIAVRPVFAFSSNGTAAHTATMEVTVSVSPRSLA